MAINSPGQIIEEEYVSDDFEAIGIVFSKEFLKSLELSYNFQADMILKSSPIINLKDAQIESILTYYDLISKLLKKGRPYQPEILQHLTCAFFYAMGSYLYQIDKINTTSSDETLMARFLNEIKSHFHHQRQVSFYAKQLCISAGHLSTSIKRFRHNPPSEWINLYVIQEAKVMLKCSDLTIQQISDSPGFPSQSFFGKFFKRLTKLSSSGYRRLPGNVLPPD